jgi:hypothetical protein
MGSRLPPPRVLGRLVDDLLREPELGRMDQADVHPVARRQHREIDGHADRLLVTRGVGPADGDRLPARVALLLEDRQQVGQGLVRVVEVTLHVEHRHATCRSDIADVPVADAPVHVPDGDPVVVAPEDLADLPGGIAVGDLGRPRFDELGVAAELGHPGLEGRAGPRGGEEEQHREHAVAEQGMGNPEGSFPLQLEGDLQDGVDFLLRPFLEADQVAAAKVRLHQPALTRPRRGSAPACPS